MDEIVKQAMAKWPNVPHCYGWLLLDSRGAWRMRDEHAQALNLPGERINNPALLEFIHRNYTHDENGQWYFQNGPQRVYVTLQTTPFIARMHPMHGLLLHTGEAFWDIDSAWMTEQGEFLVYGAGKPAMLDDRDLGLCVDCLRIADAVPNEEQLMAWLDGTNSGANMMWRYREKEFPVQRILRNKLADRFNFFPRPAKDFPANS
ncbi:MAG: DUF2946 family protein [Burkholderiaceae bacterium]